jgi:hypothetical protein
MNDTEPNNEHMTENDQQIYIVCEFIGSGYTIGHIATQRKIREWKNIKAFTTLQEAKKCIELLTKQHGRDNYDIEPIPIDIPQLTP